MNDKLDFLLTALDYHLSRGLPALEALGCAVEDYQFVYLVDDGRTPLARAAERALAQLKEYEGEVQ